MSGEKVFTLGSLFSGIGGLEYGLEMTGRFRTVWQVEKDEYCRKVLRKHWPQAIQFEDVRNVGRENLPAVDVICGGFPCQDVSMAGNRVGIEGSRSGLWREYARIIREVRPSYVIVENVPGLLIGGGLGVVLGDMAVIGYDAEWTVLSAAEVGAPHLRERVFALAYAPRDDVAWRGHSGVDKRHRKRNEAHSGNGFEDVGNANVRDVEGQRASWLEIASTRHREEQPQRASDGAGESWATEPAVGRVAHGVPHRVDRLRALGNAVVPQCARVIGEWLLEIDRELNAEGAA